MIKVAFFSILIIGMVLGAIIYHIVLSFLKEMNPPMRIKQHIRFQRDIRAGEIIEFDYIDSQDTPSTRLVTVRIISDTHIKGLCHDRNEERTFRIDRITSHIYDHHSGDILIEAEPI